MTNQIRRAVLGALLLFAAANSGIARADVKNLSIGVNGVTCPT